MKEKFEEENIAKEKEEVVVEKQEEETKVEKVQPKEEKLEIEKTEKKTTKSKKKTSKKKNTMIEMRQEEPEEEMKIKKQAEIAILGQKIDEQLEKIELEKKEEEQKQVQGEVKKSAVVKKENQEISQEVKENNKIVHPILEKGKLSKKANQVVEEKEKSKLESQVEENKEEANKEGQESIATGEDEKTEEVKTEKKPTSHRARKVIAIIVAILVLIGLAFSTVFALINKGSDKIIEGIQIKGVNVGGLTRDEAETKLNEVFSEQRRKDILLKHDDFETSITPEQIELNFKVTEAVELAYSMGRTGNVFKDNYDILYTKLNVFEINPDYAYNDDLLTNFITSTRRKFTRHCKTK